MTMTATDASTIAPLSHREAMALAATEYGRVLELLRSLTAEEWRRRVDDCPAWDVRQLAAHLDGNAAMAASIREARRQQRLGAPIASERGLPSIDGMTEVQVREREDWTPERIVEACEVDFARALKARRRLPAMVRLIRQDFGPPIGRAPIGYLYDLIFTRDVWMHRVDVCRAVGREMTLTPEHDGRVVADVVREWAASHREAFTLRLEGPAGATFTQGSPSVGAPEITLGAVEFCRIVSGRGDGSGLLSNTVPF